MYFGSFNVPIKIKNGWIGSFRDFFILISFSASSGVAAMTKNLLCESAIVKRLFVVSFVVLFLIDSPDVGRNTTCKRKKTVNIYPSVNKKNQIIMIIQGSKSFKANHFTF